jgi:hypothetical protein
MDKTTIVRGRWGGALGAAGAFWIWMLSFISTRTMEGIEGLIFLSPLTLVFAAVGAFFGGFFAKRIASARSAFFQGLMFGVIVFLICGYAYGTIRAFRAVQSTKAYTAEQQSALDKARAERYPIYPNLKAIATAITTSDPLEDVLAFYRKQQGWKEMPMHKGAWFLNGRRVVAINQWFRDPEVAFITVEGDDQILNSATDAVRQNFDDNDTKGLTGMCSAEGAAWVAREGGVPALKRKWGIDGKDVSGRSSPEIDGEEATQEITLGSHNLGNGSSSFVQAIVTYRRVSGIWKIVGIEKKGN